MNSMMLGFRLSVRDSLLAAVAAGCFAVSVLTGSQAHALSLKEVLEETYNTNPVIKSEREALSATDERVAQAVSEWRPTISGDYSTGRQETQFGGGKSAYSDKITKQLTLEQPIFNGGGSVARYRSAKLQVEAGRARLDGVTQDILLQSVTAYLDVVRDEEVLKLSSNNVDVLGRQLDASRERFDVGEVTRTDVAQSEARQARAVAEKSQADGALAASRAIFYRLVGLQPDYLETVAELPKLPDGMTEALAVAMENSPALLQAIYTESASKKEISSNKSRLLPSVTLQAYKREEEGAGVTGNGDFDSDVVTLNFSVPLYQSGAEYSRVREAKQNREKARYDTLDARNEVRESITRAWEGLVSSTAAIRANQSAIEAAEVALEGVKQEQQYGARTVLDVLDAEQELFAAKVNLVRAQRNELVAAYTLLASMGELSPEALGLSVASYDPKEHYEDVDYKPIGF